MSSSRCLRLLPRPPVTSILPGTLSSNTRFRKQFLRKRDQFSLPSFVLLYVGCYFPPLYTSGLTDLVRPSPAQHFRTLNVFLIYFPKCTNNDSTQTKISYFGNVLVQQRDVSTHHIVSSHRHFTRSHEGNEILYPFRIF
jgi:hypothetical protein